MKLPFCFLPIDKAAGWSSHDCVAKIRNQLKGIVPRKTKVGHTGTLDPFASGLLLVAIGKATRFSDAVHLYNKTYEAEITLGKETTTLDTEGESVREMPVPEITREQLDACQRVFTGRIEQVPPAFSAKRIKGVRSYKLAREKRAVDLKPICVDIESIELAQVSEERIHCRVTCSTGTYIRTLGSDIAQFLGTVGHVSRLRRTSIGPIHVERAFQIDGDLLFHQQCQAHALSVSRVLPDFPEIELPFLFQEDLLQGRKIDVPGKRFPAVFLGVLSKDGVIRSVFKCQYDSRTRSILPKMLCYKA
ncbi:MAG: tRNA pseudouridine(55) synthase TruB [Acidobacteria bacterium]|nr:MAG: tRNA pseudouridine(55) synthase TruB [Acidobacteriota bacterium]